MLVRNERCERVMAIDARFSGKANRVAQQVDFLLSENICC